MKYILIRLAYHRKSIVFFSDWDLRMIGTYFFVTRFSGSSKFYWQIYDKSWIHFAWMRGGWAGEGGDSIRGNAWVWKKHCPPPFSSNVVRNCLVSISPAVYEQHFVPKLNAHIFCNLSLSLYIFLFARKLAEKQPLKCWWNWLFVWSKTDIFCLLIDEKPDDYQRFIFGHLKSTLANCLWKEQLRQFGSSD